MATPLRRGPRDVRVPGPVPAVGVTSRRWGRPEGTRRPEPTAAVFPAVLSLSLSLSALEPLTRCPRACPGAAASLSAPARPDPGLGRGGTGRGRRQRVIRVSAQPLSRSRVTVLQPS